MYIYIIKDIYAYVHMYFIYTYLIKLNKVKLKSFPLKSGMRHGYSLFPPLYIIIL
jgi:hypothetical protein